MAAAGCWVTKYSPPPHGHYFAAHGVTLVAPNYSAAARFLGTGEVLDYQASITVNGIPGFYVTRKCGNEASILPGQIQEKLSFWQQRQYVLHDGSYQYYIVAMWPVDVPAQRGVCEAIIATLKPC